MQKITTCLWLLAICAGPAASAYAQAKHVVILKSTERGAPIPRGALSLSGPHSHGVGPSRTQNNLTDTLNQMLVKEKASLGRTASSIGSASSTGSTVGIVSGTANTVPYFNSWFVTGTRNSIYTYSMVGQSPVAGGTTRINNEIIPVITALFDGNENLMYIFDPTVVHDPQGTDVSLVEQSPIYDATTTYPGNGGSLPPDSGQFVDTVMRASFSGVRTADWHTLLNAPTVATSQYIQVLFYENGDWACVGGEAPPCTSIPVVNIGSMFNIFQQILNVEKVPNNTIPILLTDYVVAYDSTSGNCCEVGNHATQPGIVDPTGILVYIWATFLPQTNDPFAPGFADVSILSHELSELWMDPFTNTTVAPWVDGSVQFPQATLETGDVIERMKSVDAIYTVPLSPNGKPYTYHLQNEALLQWFTRTPVAPVSGPGPGVYSWPNTNTLNNGHNPAGPCGGNPGCWVYGEGPGGFLFGPPY